MSNKIRIQIENWSVCTDNPYAPPELGIAFLVGEVYGHPVKADGKVVQTSYIEGSEGREVTTHTGHTYILGTVDPEFLKWCEDKKIHLPVGDEPLKWNKTNE